jgi:hypothetical protein
MRKLLTLGVVTAALGLSLAPAAEAHHLQQNDSTLGCVLVNNVPTIHVSAHYVGFTPGDQPITYVLHVDEIAVVSGNVPLHLESDFRHELDYVTTPGIHQVDYDAVWNRGRDRGGWGDTVNCPVPVPPPVLCNDQPVPPGTNCVTPPPPPPATPPVLDCKGAPMPPGSTPPKCHVTPSSTPPKCVLTRVHRKPVHVGARNTITVHTAAGTIVRLHLPKTKTIKRTAPASGVVSFHVRPKHSGHASVTGASCGKVTLRVHRRHKTITHKVPEVAG